MVECTFCIAVGLKPAVLLSMGSFIDISLMSWIFDNCFHELKDILTIYVLFLFGPTKWRSYKMLSVQFYFGLFLSFCLSFSLFVSLSVFPISKVSLSLQYGRTELFKKNVVLSFSGQKGPKWTINKVFQVL